MKLPDVNILLYAADEFSPRHHAALAWVNETLSGSETVALAWATMVGFVRISTNPAAFSGALAPGTALDLVEYADTRFGSYPKLAASDDFRFIRRSWPYSIFAKRCPASSTLARLLKALRRK